MTICHDKVPFNNYEILKNMEMCVDFLFLCTRNNFKLRLNENFVKDHLSKVENQLEFF